MIPVREMIWPARNDPFVPAPCRADLHQSELDDEAVLSDPRTGNVFHLNPTALAVWRLCDGEATTLEMARRQSAAYSVSVAAALDDVEQVVAVLMEWRLLSLQEGQ